MSAILFLYMCARNKNSSEYGLSLALAALAGFTFNLVNEMYPNVRTSVRSCLWLIALQTSVFAAGKGRARDKHGKLVQGKDVEQGMSACCEGLKIDTMCPSNAMAAFESDKARLASATEARGEEAHDRSALGVKPNF